MEGEKDIDFDAQGFGDDARRLRPRTPSGEQDDSRLYVGMPVTAPGSRLPDFDADFSPGHDVNQAAADARRLRFDARKESYVDEDGGMVRDRFGQPY